MNNLNNAIPVLSVDLINELDMSIPKGVLTKKDFNKSLQEIWYEAGQRALVDTLKIRLENTKDSLLP